MLKILGAASMMILLVDATPAEAQSYPQVRDIGRGNTEVRTSRNCRILYDRRGDRESTSRTCSGREIQRAARLLRDHRWHSSTGGNHGNRPSYGNRFPYARELGNYRTEVNMTRNCRMVYNLRADRTSTSRGCTSRDILGAVRVLRDHRRNTPAYALGNDYRPGSSSNLLWLRGRDADYVRDQLDDNGFNRVDRWRPDYGGRYSTWWNNRTRQCIRLYERRDRAEQLYYSDREDCRT